MGYKNIDIQMILPENEVHWKIIFCPQRRLKYNEYRISIELNDKKRQYTCVSFEDLFKLIQKISIEKRCFYEHISRGDTVKFYLDFEYCRTDQNAMINVNKALLSIQKLFINMIKIISKNDCISIHDMIVLKSSSSKKESYHIILSDRKIRFSSTHSLYLFVQEILRIMLIFTLEHECFENRKYNGKEIDKKSSLSEIINAFKCVRLEWFGCVNCKIKILEISVSDVCNLFAYKENGHLIPCIDLKVYGIEQDFRMFMCTKVGENRPLMNSVILEDKLQSSSIEVFHPDKESSILILKEIFQKSLITEPPEDISYYINSDNLYEWLELVGLNIAKDRKRHIENEIDIRKKPTTEDTKNILARTDRESKAEQWTRNYLKNTGSTGIIHSINTGKHGRLILCNIRNMNVCKNSHEDYFNDTTIYINIEEKQFCIRCNRIPCKKKRWIWESMV